MTGGPKAAVRNVEGGSGSAGMGMAGSGMSNKKNNMTTSNGSVLGNGTNNMAAGQYDPYKPPFGPPASLRQPVKINAMRFREHLKVMKKLGEGAFGVVHECRRRQTGEVLAV